jgi:hypothetical protein
MLLINYVLTNVYENNWSAKNISQLKKNSALPAKNGLKPCTENFWDSPKKIGHCP